ncbi:MAG: hypothetical protein J6Y71_04515 [Ruminococcus sp.]|nr:hypothetical protein [Ruminococcus sp.]
MEHFKNRALSRVDGVITGHCIMCGKYLGNEYDTNYYALIRRKYCEEHAEAVHSLSMQAGRRRYKDKQRKTVKAMRSLIDEYMYRARLLQEYNEELQRELDDLKRRRL